MDHQINKSTMQSAAKSLSFQQILDEELARKLAAEEEPFPQKSQDPIPIEADKQSQELSDYLLALKLSQQLNDQENVEEEDEEYFEDNQEDNQQENQEENQEIQNNNETEDDYILALRLQTEYEMEEDRELRMRLEREKGTSKVSICYDNLLQTHPSYFQHESYIKKKLPTDSDTSPDFSVTGAKKKSTKPKGRVSLNAYNKTMKESTHPLTKNQNFTESEEIITKHDSEIASIININRIEYSDAINSGDLHDTGIQLNTIVSNGLLYDSNLISQRKSSKQGKEERETHDKVIDTQTRILLFKLINSGKFTRLEGIINSGKEANVYRGINAEQNSICAVKIFKTTLNEFKNREIYIKDDFRFRHRCNKQSSNKFISVWAEKEMDNLIRLAKVGIKCPTVLVQKKNILVLSYLGVPEQPAPQLRHVQLSSDKFSELYQSCIRDMRIIFQKARLVHADLSEYNLLYHNDSLYFIDVAQSVEIQHPYALYFLRRDCNSINTFFKKRSVAVLSNCELFNYITDSTINDDNEADYLDSVFKLVHSRLDLTPEQQVNEQVFMQSFIPQELNQITDPISEIERAMDGNTSDIFHRAFTGVNENFSGIRTVPDILQDVDHSNSSEDEEEIDDQQQEIDEQSKPSQPTLSKEDQRKLRKQAKKDFKQKQRETRQMKQKLGQHF